MFSKRELEAGIRNKLSMPLVVLEMMRKEERVPREKIELAIRELKMVLTLLQKYSKTTD